jgi:hypothetical protein
MLFSGLNPVSVAQARLALGSVTLISPHPRTLIQPSEASFLGIQQEPFLCSSPMSHRVRLPKRGDEL